MDSLQIFKPISHSTLYRIYCRRILSLKKEGLKCKSSAMQCPFAFIDYSCNHHMGFHTLLANRICSLQQACYSIRKMTLGKATYYKGTWSCVYILFDYMVDSSRKAHRR